MNSGCMSNSAKRSEIQGDSPNAAAVCWYAAEEHDAAFAGAIKWVQSRTDFDDDDGAQGKVSENSVGEPAVSSISSQREAALARRCVVEAFLNQKRPRTSRLQTSGVGASLTEC